MRKATRRWLLLVVVPLALTSAYLQFRKPAPRDDAVAVAERARAQAAHAAAELARELERTPDNPSGWISLARAYGSLAQWEDAAQAFARVGPTLEGSADWLAASAEVEYHRAGGRFTAAARERFEKALTIDPRNIHAQTLAASDAMQREDWAQALRRWQALLADLPAASADAGEVRLAIEQVRTRIANR